MDYFTHNMRVLWKVILFCFVLIFWTVIWIQKPQILEKPQILKDPKNWKNPTPLYSNNSKKVYKKVLIMAYWRTGSTYFGQLLSRYPNTYYNYEPLHLLSNRRNHWKNYTEEEGIHLIEDIFNCDFQSNLSMKYLLHIKNHRRKVTFQVPYLLDNCKHETYRNSLTCFNSDLHAKLCTNSTMNMIKTVRLRISAVKVLIENYPDMKVIVLVRDPRAVLNSRWTGFSGWCGDKPHCKEVSSFCNEFTNDISGLLDMINNGVKNIHIVRYEDLVSNRSNIVTNTLKSLGVTITYERVQKFFNGLESDKKYLYNAARSGLISYRRKPEMVATKWLSRLPESVVDIIQKRCEEPMKLLGYPDRHSIFEGKTNVIQPYENIR